MGTCEVCGESGDLMKTKVEGTTLKLCDDCQDLGEVVGSPAATPSPTPTKQSTSKSRSSRDDPDDELAEDFSTRVKQAREQKNMSPKELAETLKEKKSVVHRVETGKLFPDRKLAKKLENALGITLYETTSSATGYEQDTDSAGAQTIGDVADVRDRS